MAEEDDPFIAQVNELDAERAKRATKHQLLDATYEGNSPIPKAVQEAKVTKAYRMLMPMAEAPWGSLIVDSVQDRLEVAGIRSADKTADDAVWGSWQDNQMDAESKLAHNCALVSGRSFALVWRGQGGPEISLDTPEQMIVKYRPGSRRHRVAALRKWVEDNEDESATLYLPGALYKFMRPKGQADKKGWQRREVDGELWPLPNPFGVVPVVELAVNRRLKPGAYGYARGEFEHCLGLIDRINLLTFLGLVVAFWMGFPLRGVIGDKILRDDDNKILPPFEATADSVFQLENPDAKIVEYSAADRGNLSLYHELDQLATITKTPRHYLPLEQGMSNLAADAIRAFEGGLHAKCTGHKASLGDGHEEILRLCGMALDAPVALSPRAELLWKDHEFRSLAERADAASKLKDILPWQPIAERVLNATVDEISRWETARAGEGLNGLLLAAANPPAPA